MDKTLQEGLVIKAIAGFFYLEYNNQILECKSSTKLKKNKEKVIPGDNVLFDLEQKYIKEVLPRKNSLVRPLIANVSNDILVFSLSEPDLNYGLLDRMLMIMEYNNLKSYILLTKIDLLTKEQLDDINKNLLYYEKIGYPLIYNNEVDTKDKLLNKIKPNEKYVLTGQSGVGKSTYLNAMDSTLHIKTQEISKVLGRGKHTTKETTFYKIDNTYLIDTPGFSSFDLELTKENIRDNFIDFVNLAKDCKFNGCYHINEPQCKVKEEVKKGTILKSRYDNYVKLMEVK